MSKNVTEKYYSLEEIAQQNDNYVPVWALNQYDVCVEYYMKNFPEIVKYVNVYRVVGSDRSVDYKVMISDDCPLDLYERACEFLKDE
jgi:hypothetical protein